MWNVATGSGNRSSGLLEDVIAKADGNHHTSSNVRRYNSQPSDITLTDTTSGDIDSSVMLRRSRGLRFDRHFLWLYPREFREEYGEEMAYIYRRRAAEENAVRLWLALLGDAVRTAPREHFFVLRQDVRHAFRLFRRTPIVTATAL